MWKLKLMQVVIYADVVASDIAGDISCTIFLPENDW